VGSSSKEKPTVTGAVAVATRLQSLNKETLEFGQNRESNIVKQAVQHEANLHIPRGSLVERYKHNDIGIHSHLKATSTGTVHNRKWPDFCILLQSGKINVDEKLSVNDFGLNLTHAASKIDDKQPSVLVNVAEVIDNPEHGFVKVLPVVVRLQTLDFCNSICGNPVEPALLSDLIVERFQCFTHGKHIVFTGSVLRSKYKFPHQIIEGRAQVLETIADDNRQASGNGASSLEGSDVLIRIALCLSHHLAWVRLEIPTEFGLEFHKMHFSPEDFLPNRV